LSVQELLLPQDLKMHRDRGQQGEHEKENGAVNQEHTGENQVEGHVNRVTRDPEESSGNQRAGRPSINSDAP
jgi:hypothetical protein